MRRTNAASRRGAEARIKLMCCLGLRSEAIMPALLRELHTVIPSHSGGFYWPNEQGELVNAYDENTDSKEFAQLYLQEFYNRRECEVTRSFTWTMRHVCGARTRDRFLTVDNAALYKSDLYNLVLRPLGYDDTLQLVVRDGGRAVGGLQIYRTPQDRPFTTEEERRLARLEPFIAHALAEPGTLDAPLAESEDSGLILANGDGKPLHVSPEARRLLFLANHETIGPGGLHWDQALLPGPVARLCRALRDVFAGKADAPPPRYRHRNKWGGFVFRAYPLAGPEAASDLMGITISREEPLALRLMRRVEGLPLTPRQGQICVLLALGLSHNGIAHRLDISEQTAIAHGRWIYDKLDVHNRVELANRLLAGAETCSV